MCRNHCNTTVNCVQIRQPVVCCKSKWTSYPMKLAEVCDQESTTLFISVSVQFQQEILAYARLFLTVITVILLLLLLKFSPWYFIPQNLRRAKYRSICSRWLRWIIRQLTAEILQFEHFQDGRCPPYWIVQEVVFDYSDTSRCLFLPTVRIRTEFHQNRSMRDGITIQSPTGMFSSRSIQTRVIRGSLRRRGQNQSFHKVQDGGHLDNIWYADDDEEAKIEIRNTVSIWWLSDRYQFSHNIFLVVLQDFQDGCCLPSWIL